MSLRTDGSATISILKNKYIGDFVDSEIYAPNETSGARVNSIATDGEIVRYPGAIDLDEPWTNAPPGGEHINVRGFGRVCAIRDAAIKMDGRASLGTVAGEYVEFDLTASSILRDCNVTVSFWASLRAAQATSVCLQSLKVLPIR